MTLGLLLLSIAAAPAAELREMATDRPDDTESPFTVPAGHVQVEMDVVSLALERAAPGAFTVRVLPVNLKLGLTGNSDLQLVVETFDYRRESSPAGDLSTSAGSGAVTLRLKVNLWGDDGGPTALGLLPFVTLPLASDASTLGGGLVVPLSLSLPAGFELGLMAGVEVAGAGEGHELVPLFTGTVSHELWGDLGAYVEVSSHYGLSARALEIAADGGLTYAISKDAQVDAGVRMPVTGPATLDTFVGLSFRI